MDTNIAIAIFCVFVVAAVAGFQWGFLAGFIFGGRK